MQIRFMGKPDLLIRIKNLIAKQAKIYPNRGSNEARLFVNISDGDLEQWLDLIETAEFPIEIDPKDFA